MKRSEVVLCVLAAAVLAAVPALAEDTAVLVGVSHHQYMPGSNLPDISMDIAGMETVVREHGFRKIVKLQGTEATRANIEQAIANAAAGVKSGERFLVYWSSHGTPDRRVLCYDTTTDLSRNSVSNDELRAWALKAPTSNRTVILDACYAGAFKSGERGMGGMINKLYVPPKLIDGDGSRCVTYSRPHEIAVPSGASSSSASSSALAWLLSSRYNETSGYLPGKGSLFTIVLTAVLRNAASRIWDQVYRAAFDGTVEAARRNGATQQPDFRVSDYYPARVFTTSVRRGDEGVNIGTLREFAETSQVRTSALRLDVQFSPEPPEDAVPGGTTLTINITVGTPGWLFVINADDTMAMQMESWRRTSYSNPDETETLLNESYIEKPGQFSYGEGGLQIETPRRKGTETFKALLFTSKERARAFVRAWLEMRKVIGNDEQPVTSRDIAAKLCPINRLTPGDLTTYTVSFPTKP